MFFRQTLTTSTLVVFNMLDRTYQFGNVLYRWMKKVSFTQKLRFWILLGLCTSNKNIFDYVVRYVATQIKCAKANRSNETII